MHENAPQNIWTSIFPQDLMNIMLFYNMSKPQPILDIQEKIAVKQSFLDLILYPFSFFKTYSKKNETR